MKVKLVPITDEQAQLLREASKTVGFLQHLTGNEKLREQHDLLFDLSYKAEWSHSYELPDPVVEGAV